LAAAQADLVEARENAQYFEEEYYKMAAHADKVSAAMGGEGCVGGVFWGAGVLLL
jgi:hypothetical protein